MQGYQYCEQLVREADKDRFLATLYAPAERRGALYALYAFDLEVARVRTLAHQALPGELRLQWWREVLQRRRNEEAAANPVAAALLDAIARMELPPAPLLGLLDARAFDLYDQPVGTVEELQVYVGRISGAIMQTAAFLLVRREHAAGASAAAGHAGAALGICDLLRAFPLHAARRQLYVPREMLHRYGIAAEQIHTVRMRPGLLAAFAEMRELAGNRLAQLERLIADVPSEAVPALLPAASIPLYLGRMERSGYDPFKTRIDVPQWRRQWALWLTALRWSYRKR
jgi:15-cis-phytoene synthase